MRIFRSRPVAALAMAAVLSLSATPAFARGWGHHRDRDRVSTGDIFAGLLVIGGIAAIASAASKKNKESRDAADYRYPDTREPGTDGRPDYRERDPGYGHSVVPPVQGYRSDNLDRIVDACVGEVERGGRSVEAVDSINRAGDGWHVQGQADGGTDFTCEIDSDGDVRDVRLGGQSI